MNKSKEMLYCHTDGYFDNRDLDKHDVQFCTKDKLYEIMNLHPSTVEIINDLGDIHEFSIHSFVIEKNDWFSLGKKFLSEKIILEKK